MGGLAECLGDEASAPLPPQRCWPRRTLAGNFSRIAAPTESSEISPEIAANPPSSAALGSGRPMCLSANSVAGTVHRRSARKPAANSPSPRSSKLREVLIST